MATLERRSPRTPIVVLAAALSIAPACDRRSGSGAEVIATAERLPAEPARPQGGTRARARGEPVGDVDLTGLWYIGPTMNQLSRPDIETAQVSIARGDASGSYSVAGLGDVRFRGVATIDGSPPRLRVDETDDEQHYTCEVIPGGISVICDNGEPPGIGSQYNPRHRSFGLVKLCRVDGGLAFCPTGAAADGG